MDRIERQEIYCHNCGKYVQFDINVSLNGNHVLPCPVCGHEHCRVVKDGEITGERWAQRNGPTIQVTTRTVTYSIQSNVSTDFASASWGSSFSSSTVYSTTTST